MAFLPNIITAFRIFGSLSLVFIEPLTVAFFIIYTLSGISDALDGFIARKFGLVSELGTKLDTLADFIFYAVLLIKIFPILFEVLPTGIWIAVGVIFILRVFSYTMATLKYRRFPTLHTYLNKLSGITLFTVPYFIKHPIGVAVCIVVCAVIAIATIEELIIHIKAKSYNEATKTLLFTNKTKTVQ